MADVHRFTAFIGTDLICKKCGIVATCMEQAVDFIHSSICIKDEDPRCEATAMAVDRELTRVSTEMDEIVAELDTHPFLSPSMLEQKRKALDWLNSSDPVLDERLWS